MAILSGCDYLPSINGIGLKTACALLRQWKTIEQVIQTLKEGKKSVPARYLESFRLADKCFKHQRVYCPLKQKLDHLKQPDADWDEESDAYVGADMHPTTAKLLGEGHLDPVTLSPMTDINPGYVPGVLKRMPLTDRNQRKRKASTLLGPSMAASRVLRRSRVHILPTNTNVPTAAEDEDVMLVKRQRLEDAPSKGTALEVKAKMVRFEEPENVAEEETPEQVEMDDIDLEADLEWDSFALVALAGHEPVEEELMDLIVWKQCDLR